MRSIIPLLLVTATGACDPAPKATVGSETAMQVVLDTAVFEASAVFQVHILSATTKSGAALTCSDIPSTYRIGSSDIEELIRPAPTAQKDPSDPTRSVDLKVRVPAEQSLVVVARGLAPYKGTFVVGRGCRDNLKLQKGSTSSVAIDVKATSGKACTRPSDCEPNVTCLQGPGFEEGYCAVTGCAGGAACPPGSVCISDTAFSGICMRRCRSINDCEITQAGQDCQGRLSLSAQGCDRVCVFPNWQASNCCPAGACGTGDGGLLAALAPTLLLQWLVARPRPEVVRWGGWAEQTRGVRLVLPVPGFDAYPSGHAALAWCAAVQLSLAYRRRSVLLAGVTVAALVSLSRVYLGHHHPSDLLGGAMLGAGVGALFHGLWLAPKGPRLRWALWPQLALVLMMTQMAYLGLLPRGWDLGLPYADKLLHFTLFGLLAFWLHLWLGGRRVGLWGRGLPLAPILVLGGASLEELAQLLSVRRTADPVDLLCDVGGVLLAVWLAGRLLARRARTEPTAHELRRATS